MLVCRVHLSAAEDVRHEDRVEAAWGIGAKNPKEEAEEGGDEHLGAMRVSLGEDGEGTAAGVVESAAERAAKMSW